MHGDIMGMQQTMIEIFYTPSTFTTAECEIKFRTTEFDSQPILCRIVGNAIPSKQNVKMQGGKGVQPDEEAEFEIRKTKTRTLLTNKKDMMRTSSKAGVRLEKIPDDALSKTQNYGVNKDKSFSVEPMERNTIGGGNDDKDLFLSKTPKQGGSVSNRITVMEQNFIKEYRHLEELEREKGIKFFQCIGDPPITKDTVQSIKDQRATFIAEVQEFMRDRDVRRFRHVYD